MKLNEPFSLKALYVMALEPLSCCERVATIGGGGQDDTIEGINLLTDITLWFVTLSLAVIAGKKACWEGNHYIASCLNCKDPSAYLNRIKTFGVPVTFKDNVPIPPRYQKIIQNKGLLGYLHEEKAIWKMVCFSDASHMQDVATFTRYIKRTRKNTFKRMLGYATGMLLTSYLAYQKGKELDRKGMELQAAALQENMPESKEPDKAVKQNKIDIAIDLAQNVAFFACASLALFYSVYRIKKDMEMIHVLKAKLRDYNESCREIQRNGFTAYKGGGTYIGEKSQLSYYCHGGFVYNGFIDANDFKKEGEKCLQKKMLSMIGYTALSGYLVGVGLENLYVAAQSFDPLSKKKRASPKLI